MPTVRISGNQDPLATLGPVLFVRIGFDTGFDPVSSSHPILPSNQLTALVDTGASASCIDSELAGALQLPILDRQQLAGIHGASEHDVCLAQIYIADLNFVLYGAFFAVHLALGGQPHYALIGRDFLRHFTMTYEGRTGLITVSND